MFDSLFGEQDKLSNAVDTYLARMDKVLKIKLLAQQCNEKNISKDMDLFIKTIAEAAFKVLKESQEEKSNAKE